MEPPFLYKGKEALSISAETVFAVVKSIVESGQEAEFLRVCMERGAVVAVAPEFVNLVKNYLFDQGLYKINEAARSAVRSAQCK